MRSNFFIALAFAAAALLLAPLAAFAQAVTAPAGVSIPWGEWVVSLLNGLASVLAAALIWLVSKYVPSLAQSFLTNSAIENAVNYGFGAVEGAVQGKALTVSSTNGVLTSAETYLVAHAPAAAAWLGAMIRPTLLAKLSSLGVLPAEVSASVTGAIIPTKL